MILKRPICMKYQHDGISNNLIFYHQRMRRGNTFGRVSTIVSVCLALNFETLLRVLGDQG